MTICHLFSGDPPAPKVKGSLADTLSVAGPNCFIDWLVRGRIYRVQQAAPTVHRQHVARYKARPV